MHTSREIDSPSRRPRVYPDFINTIDVKTYVETLAAHWSKPVIEWIACTDLHYEFPLKPREYLEFAQKDLRVGGIRGLVNALSNSKRAIDCQITSLLNAVGVRSRGTLPAKIDTLRSLGVLAPSILRKVIQLRNALEHDYHRPVRSDVEDAVDVATLFLDALEPFFSGRVYMCGCWVVDEKAVDQREFGARFPFPRGIAVVTDPAEHWIDFILVHDDVPLGEYALGPKNPLFLDVVGFLMRRRRRNSLGEYSKAGAREFLSILRRW